MGHGVLTLWAMVCITLATKEASMSFEEWYKSTGRALKDEIREEKKQEKIQKEQLKQETLWQRVSQDAKLTKLRNKKSKRDIEREVRIKELGGKPIEVLYGQPLTDTQRLKRQEVEWSLKYPNRAENKEKLKEASKKRLRELRSPTGTKRSIEQLLKATLRTAKVRAESYGVPFDITLEDLKYEDYCPVFGTKFEWGSQITNQTPSLDRVIPEKGYVKGNVRVISMRANRLKNNATVEELEKVVEYMKNHQ